MSYGFVAPAVEESAFTCAHCGVLAFQEWVRLAEGRLFPSRSASDETLIYRSLKEYQIARCSNCLKLSFWFEREMVYPLPLISPLPNPDMPESAKRDYEEARSILVVSPRGAAALLRLAIQKICIALGEQGKNLNNDIAKLVEKGVDERIQKALDVIRVVGNNAVHPGMIDVDEKPELVQALFGLVNEIVDERISKDKRINALYSALPVAVRENISGRDNKLGGSIELISAGNLEQDMAMSNTDGSNNAADDHMI